MPVQSTLGEHVVAITSDTAILVQSATTRRVLREMVVREVLCKPVILCIGRKETVIDGGMSPQMIDSAMLDRRRRNGPKKSGGK